MPTSRKPEAIVREIEQTRAELADTIDAITHRINPKRAARPEVLAAVGAVLLVGVIVMRRRH